MLAQTHAYIRTYLRIWRQAPQTNTLLPTYMFTPHYTHTTLAYIVAHSYTHITGAHLYESSYSHTTSSTKMCPHMIPILYIHSLTQK